MEIKGKLLQKLPVISGEGKNGAWKKQDLVIEQSGQIPKKICVTIWGDKMLGLTLKIGSDLTLHADAESKEFNGKWFTSLMAWKVEFGRSEGITQKFEKEREKLSETDPVAASMEESDELPF